MAKKDEKGLTFDELVELRQLTDKVSNALRSRLESYLVTLRPLLAPQRILGGSRVGGATRAMTSIRESFQAICGKPFNLRSQLEDSVFEEIDGRLVLYPWEYGHETSDGKEVTISSPVRWVLTYKSDYDLSRFRRVLVGKEERHTDEVRQFMVNSLTMDLLFKASTSLVEMLSDLRFPLTTRMADDLGSLPLVTIDACLPSFLPPEELILSTTQFSGVAAFIELIETGELESVEDPVKRFIEDTLKG